MEQMGSVPCEIMFSSHAGEIRGNEIGAYCGRQNLAPNFFEKCKETTKDALPDMMKTVFSRVIERCVA